jgi:hypothetical protein
MPYSATDAIAFAQRQVGRFEDGECWTLVERALIGAGAKSSRILTPNFSATSAYVWGTAVQINAVQPGDVLQFSRYVWTKSVTTDVTNPDGSGSVNTEDQEEGRGLPQHSALVVRVVSPGVVEVVEQNIPRNTGPVQTVQLVLVAPPPSTVRTQVRDGTGFIVTVTTTTHAVRNPPTCYRPVNA